MSAAPPPREPPRDIHGREARDAREVRWARVAWAAIALGVALRLVWGLVVHPPWEYISSDMQAYVERASRIATGGGLVRSDTFYPPGTHLLLAVPFRLFGDGADGLRAGEVLWFAMSSATPLFAWRLARELVSPAAAALAAVLCSLYPPFILYTGFFLSETPALMLLLAALWLANRAVQVDGRAAIAAALGAGLAGGAAVANRPQLLLNMAIVGLPMLWGSPRRLRAAAAFAASAAIVLGGVVAHNTAAAGELTGLAENGGLNFFQSHCDVHLVTAGSERRGGSFAFGSPVPFQLGEGRDFVFPDRQVWDEGFFYGEGLDCVRRDGLGHVGRLARNMLDATATTTPFPIGDLGVAKATADAANIGYSLLLPLIVTGALVLMGRRPRAEAAGLRQLLLHLAALLPVILVYDSEPRFRILYDAFGLILLAALITALRAHRTARRSARTG